MSIKTQERKVSPPSNLPPANYGEAAFPSFDEFDEIEIMLYASENSELAKVSSTELEVVELARLMCLWFKKLIALPWLKLLADKGDDTLKTWLDDSVIGEEIQDHEKFWATFADNESILSMILGVKFHSKDVEFVQRVQRRLKQKNRLIGDTTALLLGEEPTQIEEFGSGDDKLEEVAFLIRCALKAMHMPNRKKIIGL